VTSVTLDTFLSILSLKTLLPLTIFNNYQNAQNVHTNVHNAWTKRSAAHVPKVTGFLRIIHVFLMTITQRSHCRNISTLTWKFAGKWIPLFSTTPKNSQFQRLILMTRSQNLSETFLLYLTLYITQDFYLWMNQLISKSTQLKWGRYQSLTWQTKGFQHVRAKALRGIRYRK